MVRHLAASLICIAQIVLIGVPAFTRGEESVRRHYQTGVMGTALEFVVWGADTNTLDQAILAAEKEMRRIEDLMTDWRSSPLQDLNCAAGAGPVVVERELAAIIARSLAVSKLTHGAFDPTYASAGTLWDFKADPPVIPGKKRIEEALTHVGADRVQVNSETLEIRLPKGSRIGLGGIAKGYGVDRAMQVLRDAGVRHAMVNAGGDMKLLGRDGGHPWEIAIKNPRNPDKALAVLHLSNQCLVTSGDYERFVEWEGERYHHILDPRTGYPATGCMSASVVAPNAELADALATALCVLGPEKGLALIQSLEHVEALVVGMDGQVHTTPGLDAANRLNRP